MAVVSDTRLQPVRTAPTRPHEEDQALQCCQTALGARPHLLLPYGLERRDIIEYFDPADFMPNPLTWARLGEDYHRARASDRYMKTSYKDWLSKLHSAATGVTEVRNAAAKAADHPPVELTDLLDLCVRLAGGIRT